MQETQNNILKTICGLKVTGIDLSKEKTILVLDSSVYLAIYNNFTLNGVDSSTQLKLIGCTVTNVLETDSLISIIFNDIISINIDMQDDAYNGPEAIQLRLKDNKIVVWN